MSTSLPMSNIPATPDDASDLNQARQIAISLFPYKAADTYLSICEEENMQNPVRLNVSCILTDAYDEN